MDLNTMDKIRALRAEMIEESHLLDKEASEIAARATQLMRDVRKITQMIQEIEDVGSPI